MIVLDADDMPGGLVKARLARIDRGGGERCLAGNAPGDRKAPGRIAGDAPRPFHAGAVAGGEGAGGGWGGRRLTVSCIP